MAAVTVIDIPAWGNANIAEIIWLLSGLAAVAASSVHLPELLRDFGLASGERRKEFVMIARGYVRRELVRLIQGVCISVFGLYAVTQPPAFGKDIITPSGLVLTVLLFVQSGLVSAQSVWDWRDRRGIEVMIRQAPGGQ